VTSVSPYPTDVVVDGVQVDTVAPIVARALGPTEFLSLVDVLAMCAAEGEARAKCR
jgi:hypothetical protein